VLVKVKKRQNVCFQSVFNGRRRLLTDSDARLLMSNMRKEKLLTPKEASKELNKTVSQWTTRRALGRIGYVASVTKNKSSLSEKNVRARLQFAKTHKNWTIEDWKRVVWSDESKFSRFQSDGKQYYWHRPGDKQIKP